MEESSARNKQKTILIVEDNRDLRQSLMILLECLGHHVISAATGTGALHEAERITPEIALIDICLPDMDGYELAQRLYADPRLQEIKLVALSGYNDSSYRDRARAQGFKAFLAKPIGIDDLTNIINRL